MNTKAISWLALPLLLLLAGCPEGGGGGGGLASPVPPVAYVISSGPNEVQAYTINGTTGALTPVGFSPVALGAFAPTSIAVSSNGLFAYITLNRATDNVLAFTVNNATGALTQVSGSPFDAGASPTAVTVSPNGQFLYVVSSNNTVSAFTIGLGGALTPTDTETTGTTPSGVVVSPNNLFLYVSNQGSDNVSAFTIDGTTGALTPVGAPSPSPYPTNGTSPSAVTVSPNGSFLYVSNQVSNNVSAFRINATTGALAFEENELAGTSPNGVAVSPNNSFLYVSNQVSNNVSVFGIDNVTGELSPVETESAGTTPSGITVEPNGQFVFVSNSGGGSGDVSGYRITTGTGALVSLGAPFPAGATPVGIATPGRP